MSRRSRERRRMQGGYTPPAKPRPKQILRPYKRLSIVGPLPLYHPPPPRAPLALVHTARRRPVRHLMRTVLTDIRPRAGTRTHLDVSRRAIFRSRSQLSPWEVSPVPQVYERNFVCARRSIRREVLFAIRGTGKGARSPRKRSENSNVRC